MQAPTGYTGIYAGWNVDLDNADGDDDPATGPDDWWDFRSGSRYPVLKLDPDSRPSANGTYDTDGDGLIEVSTLEQLDVIRWSKDSPGEAVGGWGNNRSAAAAFPTGGEVCNVCYGYELVRSLDFQDAGSYASGEVNTAWIRGEGWDPEDFDGTLYGNGHTISNLYINRPDKSNVGFFGEVEGTVRNIGLIDVDVTGNKRVGGLAGTNDGLRLGYKREGNIIASYATGSVTGNEGVGGLVGANYESGVIIASYADASVSGKDYVAGLVGRNYESSSYATGSVTGNEGVGGLVGQNEFDAFIIASYATGGVTGANGVGGLVRSSDRTHDEGGIMASYWNTQTSGQTAGGRVGEFAAGLEGKTTAELQAPTGYTGIYASWNTDLENATGDDDPATGATDFWDFGTKRQYPILKWDIDGDGTATWQEFGNQPGVLPARKPTAAPAATSPPSAPEARVRRAEEKSRLQGRAEGAASRAATCPQAQLRPTCSCCWPRWR